MKEIELAIFIDRLARSGWKWGESDCTMAVADWIKQITGADPASQWRGRYHSADEARALAKAEGGFVPRIGEILDCLPLERTTDPETGDVGVILASHRYRNWMPVVGAIMAIRLGDLWVAKAARGIIAQPFEHLVAWRT